MRVLIGDDHGIVRSGIRLLLERQPDIEVIAEAADGAEARDLAVRERPDLAILDVRMPNLTGLQATREIKRQARDVSKLQELRADYAIEVTVKSPPPRVELQARVRRLKTGAVDWEETLAGDPLAAEQALLEGLTRALERVNAWPVTLTDADRARLRKGPTANAQAFAAYAEARALLDRRVPANVTRAVELL